MGLSNGDIAGISIGCILIILVLFYINRKINNDRTIMLENLYKQLDIEGAKKEINKRNELEEIKKSKINNINDLEGIENNWEDKEEKKQELREKIQEETKIINNMEKAQDISRKAEDDLYRSTRGKNG